MLSILSQVIYYKKYMIRKSVNLIVITIVALILLFLLANAVWGVIFVLAVAVYWVFYQRALRLALVKSRICKGKFVPSLDYGLMYTTMYSGWIYRVLLAFKFFR